MGERIGCTEGWGVGKGCVRKDVEVWGVVLRNVGEELGVGKGCREGCWGRAGCGGRVVSGFREEEANFKKMR